MDGSGSSPVELGDALQSMQQQVHGVRRGQEERKFSAVRWPSRLLPRPLPPARPVVNAPRPGTAFDVLWLL